MSKTLQEKLAEALAYMENVNFDEMELGRHDINEDFFSSGSGIQFERIRRNAF